MKKDEAIAAVRAALTHCFGSETEGVGIDEPLFHPAAKPTVFESRLEPLDSLDRVELMMQLEDDLDIEIPDADAADLNTINQISDHLVVATQ